jgi:pimeloyl-ACP methyl ester carboxylesterase
MTTTAKLLFGAPLPFLVCFLTGCMSFHAGAMPGEPKNATFAEVEGARVRYVDRGKGPAVVLIHGFASSLETWATVMPALEQRGFRVLAMDLKGFGWTDRPEGDYSPAAQAKLVFSLMDQRRIDRATFVAHSWGTSVALAAALAKPERVARMALYDAWVYEEQLPTFFHWARAPGVGEVLFGVWYKERPDEKMAMAFFDKKYVSERLVEDVEAALDRPGTTAAALAAVRGQRYAEVETRYRTIRTPTLLLWGREDLVTTLRYGERLARDLPNARLVVYPHCGHFPMIEAAGASTHDLLTFLEPELQAASAPAAEPIAPQERPSAPSPAGLPTREYPE